MGSLQETIFPYTKVGIIVQRTKQNRLIFILKNPPPLKRNVCKLVICTDGLYCRIIKIRLFVLYSPYKLCGYTILCKSRIAYNKSNTSCSIYQITRYFIAVAVSCKETFRSLRRWSILWWLALMPCPIVSQHFVRLFKRPVGCAPREYLLQSWYAVFAPNRLQVLIPGDRVQKHKGRR